MKFLFVLFLIFEICFCQIKLSPEVLNAKDAIEAEGNKKAYNNFKKIFDIESFHGLPGE